MPKASGWFVLVVLLSAAVLYAAEDAVTALGITKGEAIDKSFFFMEGKYVKAPYVVERRGVDIYINDMLVSKGQEWPPYDYRVSEDPGEPPAGTAPGDPVPAGVDGRNTYWALKTRYVFQHYDEPTARKIMVELYRKCSTLTSVDWDPENPDHVTVTGESGVPLRLQLSVRLSHTQAPPGKEDVLRSVESHREFYEDMLNNGTVCLIQSAGNPEVMLFGDSALKMVEILLSSATGEQKLKMLLAKDVSLPDAVARNLVQTFTMDDQLVDRYRSAKEESEAKVVSIDSSR